MLLKVVLLVVFTVIQTRGDEFGFHKLGSYKGDTWTKEYYLPKFFKAFWVNTRPICKAYGMDILSLETKVEHDAFIKFCEQNVYLFEERTHIGAIGLVPRSGIDWYWMASGKLIDYPLKFARGYPDHNAGMQDCLALEKSGNKFLYDDIHCYETHEEKFICEKTIFEQPPQHLKVIELTKALSEKKEEIVRLNSTLEGALHNLSSVMIPESNEIPGNCGLRIHFIYFIAMTIVFALILIAVVILMRRHAYRKMMTKEVHMRNLIENE